MVALVALLVWRWNPFLVAFGWLIFALLDGAFLSSALTKVPTGAWFTLALAFVLSSLFILWRFGKENQWRAEAEDRIQPSRLVMKSADGSRLELTSAFGGGEISKIKGFAVFFDKIGDMTPTVFIQFLSKFAATPEVVVFFHLRPLAIPSVPEENRYTVTRTIIPNCFRLVIRHGYTDEVVTLDLARLVYEQVRNFIIREGARPAPMMNSDGETVSESSSTMQNVNANTAGLVATQLAELERAYNAQVIYIAGKNQMKIREGSNFMRRFFLQLFLWVRDNTRNKISNMKIPTDKLVEVGFIKEV